MKNNILIKHPQNWGLSESRVAVSIEKVLKIKKLSNVEISIVFVGRKKAKDLNIKYRNKSYIPQVLGFPMSRSKDEDGMTRLGDIVICSQKLKYEARFQDKPVDKVLEEWLSHGVENLLIQ